MKLKTLLIELGYPSANVKQMLSNNQIEINCDKINKDIELDIIDSFTMHLTEFIARQWFEFDENTKNKLSFFGYHWCFDNLEFFKGFLLLEVGSKEDGKFVIMKNNDNPYINIEDDPNSGILYINNKPTQHFFKLYNECYIDKNGKEIIYSNN